jgi:isoquinoline 1-oxidoreductase alpha subunit
LADTSESGLVLMQRINLAVNGKPYQVEAGADTPLFWGLRDTLGLSGTKLGCGMGLCGACKVHLHGDAVRSSSQTPVGCVGDRQVTAIEGLSTDRSQPVLRGWIADKVQKGSYCQPGQIMQAASLPAKKPLPSKKEIDEAMNAKFAAAVPIREFAGPSTARRERLLDDA